MTKFNANEYRGKVVRTSLEGYPGLSRRWVWMKDKQRYGEPPRGGRYEARRSGGRRPSRIFAKREDAIQWLRGGDLAITAHSVPGSYKIKHLLVDWQKHVWPTFRESTRIFYSKVITLLDPLMETDVESLSPQIIDNWIAELKSPWYMKRYTCRRKSLTKEYECLKTMVNWYIECNDNTKLISPFRKRHCRMAIIHESTRSQRRFMQQEEYELWLEKLREDSFLYYALGATQTMQLMRISEVCAMKWSNLDLKSRTYRLSEHVTWPRVNKQPPQILPGTKNMRAGETHILHLRKDVVCILTELEAKKTCDLIFHDKNEILTYRQVQHRYNKAFSAAKLPYSSTHVCRHTGATAFLNDTGDVLALQQMGNWSDLKVALHYGQILASRAKDAVAKADAPKLKVVRDEAM